MYLVTALEDAGPVVIPACLSPLPWAGHASPTAGHVPSTGSVYLVWFKSLLLGPSVPPAWQGTAKLGPSSVVQWGLCGGEQVPSPQYFLWGNPGFMRMEPTGQVAWGPSPVLGD